MTEAPNFIVQLYKLPNLNTSVTVQALCDYYLGFSTMAQPAAGGTYSWITSFWRIFPKSWNAYSGSLPSAALAASGLSENRVGTGPEMTSPSNISHARLHSASITAGTLSLGE